MFKISLYILVLLILTNISLLSQWQNQIGYSISSQTFNNIEEWRLYNDEIQIHIDGTSYFYDERNFKLLDEVVVIEDTVYRGSGYDDLKSFSINAIDNLFDKLIFCQNGNVLIIYDEKDNYLIDKKIFEFYDYREVFLNVKTYTIRDNNILHVFFNSEYAVTLYERLMKQRVGVLQYNVYDLTNDSLHSLHSKFTPYDYSSYYNSSIEYNNKKINFYEVDVTITPVEYSVNKRSITSFDLNDYSYKVLGDVTGKQPGNSFVSKTNQDIIQFTNDIFNIYSFQLKNTTYDSTLINSNSRLIQEVKSKIFLMKSEALGYFLYNINSKSIQTLKKLNDIDKLLELRDEKINLENNNFYALSSEDKIVRISLTSDFKNLISPNFSVDKTLADSNYVFKFENKSEGNIDSVIWDFGDGKTSIDLNPSHKYQNSGKYSVSLKCYINGNEISHSKNELIYIPTPVRLNVKYTMTMNENDATISVSNGATGSNLKHTLVYTNYPFFYEVPDIMIDTTSASGYSFTTNKSFFTKSLEFSVSNELYSASERIYFSGHEFDYWGNDIKNEINLNKVDIFKYFYDLNNSFLIDNGDELPLIVNETEKNYISVDNLKGVISRIELNKNIKTFNKKSFITNDDTLYYFPVKNGINSAQKISLKDVSNNDKILFVDNLNDDSFVFTTSESIYIIDSQGNLISEFINPKYNILFFKEYKNKLYVGLHDGKNKLIKINIYDLSFTLENSLSLNSKFGYNNSKINLYLKDDELLVNSRNKDNINILKIDINTNQISTIDLDISKSLGSSFINNKNLVFYENFTSESIGNGISNYTIAKLYDDDFNELYEYTFNERQGLILSSTLHNNNLNLYGIIRKQDGYYNTFIELDINDKLTLSLNENEDQNNFKIYPNPSKNYISIDYNQPINKIQIFDQLGKIYFQSNFYKNQLDISNLKPGVYFIKINEEETAKFIIE